MDIFIVVFGDIVEGKIIFDKAVGYFGRVTEDNSNVVGVVLPEDGVKRVFNSVY